jgi:hypothetical protein
MKWTDALKEYAKKTGKYVVPKKGTPAYDEVKKLMGASAAAAPAAAPATAPEKQTAPKKARKVFEGTAKEEANKAVEKVKRKRAAKKAAPAADAMPAVAAMVPKEKKARVAKKPSGKMVMSLGGASAEGAAHSKNPEGLMESMVNAHIAIAPPQVQSNILSEVKADVKKLSKPKVLPKLLEPETVENAPAFSISALRRLLGA